MRVSSPRIAALVLVALAILALAALLSPPVASANCAKTWVGGFSSNWEDWQNWTQCDPTPNNQEAPDSDDDVVIDGASVTLGSGTNISSLTLQGNATLTYDSANNDPFMQAPNGITVNTGSSITLDGTTGNTHGAASLNVGSSTLINNGTITIKGGGNSFGAPQLQGPLTNNGTIQVNANGRYEEGAAVTNVLDNKGIIAIADGATLSAYGQSCGDTGDQVTNDTGGQINATGSGTLSVEDYTQGAGTTSGTTPVTQNCGFVHYTGGGASTVLAVAGFRLTGTMHSGQSLKIRGDNFNTGADASASGFTNGGSITLDCPVAGCAGGGGPSFTVGSNTLINSGTFTVTANASGSSFTGGLTNTGSVQLNGSVTVSGSGTLLNQGAIDLATGTASSVGGVTMNDDTGGSINATGTGYIAINSTYDQGAGTATGTNPVVVTGGTLDYTGSGASTVLAVAGFTLTGTMHSGQSLKIRGDNYNTGANASASGFTNGGSITLDCPVAGCAGGGGPSFTVGSNTLINSGTFTVTALGSGSSFTGGLTNTGTVQLNGSATVSGSGTLLNQGAINLATGTVFSVGGVTLNDDTGGSINATGTGAIAVNSTYDQGAGTTTGTNPVVVTGGNLHYTGSGASTVLAVAGVTLTGTMHSGQSLKIRGDNYNTGANASASGFTNGGSITLDCPAGGCAGGGGPSFNVGSNTLTNSGTFTVTANASGSSLSGNLSNSGTVQIDGNTSIQNSGTYNQTAGTTTIASGASFNVDGTMTMSGGTLNGAGTVSGSVDNTGGRVAPGSSPGTLAISGNYTQGSGGTLQIAVNGTPAGQFSVLSVGGSPTLAGTLALVPSAGYAASSIPGDTITGLLTYTGTLTGQFATTTANPPLSDGKHFTPSYTAGSVSAVVGKPARPSHTALPRISGRAIRGQRLSTTNGTWTNHPTRFVYQWLRCDKFGKGCIKIAHATASHYTLTTADVSHTIRVAVRASNAGGSRLAMSSQTPVVVQPAA